MVQAETDTQLEVADFVRKAEEKLTEASAGKFFLTNDARLLPSFDRGNDDNADEENSTAEGTEHVNHPYEFGM
jgi:hypothetical protein